MTVRVVSFSPVSRQKRVHVLFLRRRMNERGIVEVKARADCETVDALIRGCKRVVVSFDGNINVTDRQLENSARILKCERRGRFGFYYFNFRALVKAGK